MGAEIKHLSSHSPPCFSMEGLFCVMLCNVAFWGQWGWMAWPGACVGFWRGSGRFKGWWDGVSGFLEEGWWG